MSQSNGTETEELQTLVCEGGHTWERVKKRGGKPKWCPDHAFFQIRPLSQRLQVPDRILAEWDEAAEMVDEEGYKFRWKRLWELTVRRYGAHENTFTEVNMVLVEEFIRHSRLAELHRLFAQANPYSETDKGTVKAHPGWALAEREQALADDLEAEMGINQPISRENGSKSPPSGASRYKSRLQEQGEDVGEIKDDAVGPEGDLL